MIETVNLQPPNVAQVQAKKSKVKSFECEICQKQFSRQGSCNTHKRLHGESTPKFQCKECPRRFNWKCNLLVHEKQHQMDKFECELCNRLFRSQECHLKHVKTCKDVGDKFKCSCCVRRFTNKYKLNHHMKQSHTNMLPFNCKTCDKKFEKSVQLRNHIHEAHLGGKPYRCDLCYKTFLTQHNLNIHSKTHRPGSERFQCKQCHLSFMYKYSLRIHMKREHNVVHIKPRKNRPSFLWNMYRCEICSKGFAYKKLAVKCTSSHPESSKSIQIGVSVIDKDIHVPLFDMNVPIHLETVAETDDILDFSNRIASIGFINDKVQDAPLDYSMKTIKTDFIIYKEL